MRLPLRAWKSTLESIGFSTEPRSRKSNKRARARNHQRRCLLESLENRALLTAYSVTTLAASGAGSLRDALNLAASSSSDDDVISFDSSLFDGSLKTIQLTTASGGSLSVGSSSNSGNLTIHGPGANQLAIDANGLSSPFNFTMNTSGGYNVTISGMKLTGASGVAINRTVLTVNTLTLDQDEISENNGAAISTNYGGTIVIENTTIANNHTGSAPAVFIGATGSPATLINDTISGNESSGAIAGLSFSYGTATLQNVTIANNRADTNTAGMGAGLTIAPGTYTINDSIVAGNFSGSTGSVASDTGTQSGGTFSSGSGSYNLIGYDRSGVFPTTNNLVASGSQIPINAKLAPLGNYGGTTRTQALLDGSPAIDAGPTSSTLTTDQRGLPRVVDGNNDGTANIDLGAFELNKPTLQVDNLGDANDGNYGPGQLTLREALAIAAVTPGADTITFAPGLTGEIDLNSPFAVSNYTNPFLGDVTISGLPVDSSGNYPISINAGGASSIFLFSYQGSYFQFAVSNLKLTGATGTVINETAPVLNSLSIDSVDISGNQGPAIYDLHSPMTLTNSNISNNTTGSLPAITITSGATSTLTGDRINNNTSTGQVGALLVTVSSTATLTSVMIEGNRADASNTGPGSTAIGGIYAGDYGGVVNLQSSIVVGNWAGANGPNEASSDLGAATSTGGHFDSSSANNTTGSATSGALPSGNNNNAAPAPPPGPPSEGTPEFVPTSSIVTAIAGGSWITNSNDGGTTWTTVIHPGTVDNDSTLAAAGDSFAFGGGSDQEAAIGTSTDFTQAGFGLSGVGTFTAIARPTSGVAAETVGRPISAASFRGISNWTVETSDGATGTFSYDFYFVLNWQAILSDPAFAAAFTTRSSLNDGTTTFTFLLPGGHEIDVYLNPVEYGLGTVVVVEDGTRIVNSTGNPLSATTAINFQATAPIGSTASATYIVGTGGIAASGNGTTNFASAQLLYYTQMTVTSEALSS